MLLYEGVDFMMDRISVLVGDELLFGGVHGGDDGVEAAIVR